MSHDDPPELEAEGGAGQSLGTWGCGPGEGGGVALTLPFDDRTTLSVFHCFL